MITFKELLEKLFKEAETTAVKVPAGKESGRAKAKVDAAIKKLTAKKFAGTKLIEPKVKEK